MAQRASGETAVWGLTTVGVVSGSVPARDNQIGWHDRKHKQQDQHRHRRVEVFDMTKVKRRSNGCTQSDHDNGRREATCPRSSVKWKHGLLAFPGRPVPSGSLPYAWDAANSPAVKR